MCWRIVITIVFLVFYFCTPASDTLSVKKERKDFCKNVIGIHFRGTNLNFVFDSSIVQLGCDTLPQIQFWKSILNLSPDSGILNLAHNRQIIETIHVKWWNKQSDTFKYCYRDSIRKYYFLPDTARIVFTTGKKHYYVWDSVFYLIDKAIPIFIENDVDPWYAQSVLLIESPGGNLRSPSGARGYFQLMKKVARKFGLKVNRQVDERLNFERSAYAAAMLFKTICIPEARKMLDSLHIAYDENELWFKLLTMHVYHAGAFNVRHALMKSNCSFNDMRMIYCLWQTRAAAFQSASQNYSQLVLTAYIQVYEKLDLLKCFRPN